MAHPKLRYLSRWYGWISPDGTGAGDCLGRVPGTIVRCWWPWRW